LHDSLEHRSGYFTALALRQAFSLSATRIAKEGLGGRFVNQVDMNEHRHLVKNEGAPKRMCVQIVGVSEKGPGPHATDRMSDSAAPVPGRPAFR